jgi:hypothetical protein
MPCAICDKCKSVVILESEHTPTCEDCNQLLRVMSPEEAQARIQVMAQAWRKRPTNSWC